MAAMHQQFVSLTHSEVRSKQQAVSLSYQKQYSEDFNVRVKSPEERQPNFFMQNQRGGSINYDEDKQSVQTATNAHHTIDAQQIHQEVRSEYSGVRGGGRGAATI